MINLHVIKDWWKEDKPVKFTIRIVFDTAEIARKTRYFFQRLFRGWSDDQLWSLGYVFVRFVLPRLHAFIENGPHGYPSDLQSQKQWMHYLKEMEWALEALKRDDWDIWKDKKMVARLDRGLDLCGKYIFTLWD